MLNNTSFASLKVRFLSSSFKLVWTSKNDFIMYDYEIGATYYNTGSVVDEPQSNVSIVLLIVIIAETESDTFVVTYGSIV